MGGREGNGVVTRLLAFLFVLLLAAPAVAADHAPPPDRLTSLLADGEQLVRKGDAGCAIPLERATLAADDLQHTDADYARALGALGLCREVQGRFGAAHRLVSRALEAAPPETTTAGRAAPWKVLHEALRRLDDRVARALVTWPDDADLYVDGEVVVGVPGAVLAVDPGRRLFEARQGGKTLAAQHVEVRAGDLPRVDLRIVAPGEKSSKQAVSARTPPGFPPGPSPFAPALSPHGVAVTVAYVGLATGIVSGIVAGVLEAQRASAAAGNASNTCAVDPTSATCAKVKLAFEQSRGARNVAIVAGSIGVTAAGVGVGLYFAGERAPATGMITVSGQW